MASLRMSSAFIPDPNEEVVESMWNGTTTTTPTLRESNENEPASSASSETVETEPTHVDAVFDSPAYPVDYRIPNTGWSAPTYGFPFEEHQHLSAESFFADLNQFQSSHLLRWRSYLEQHRDDVQKYASGHSILLDTELISLI